MTIIDYAWRAYFRKHSGTCSPCICTCRPAFPGGTHSLLTSTTSGPFSIQPKRGTEVQILKKKLQSPIEKYGVTSLAYRQQSRGHAVQSAMKMVLKSISKPYFQTKLEDVTTRSTHERFCTGGSLRRGAISSVWTFTFTFIPETANLHQGSRPHKILTTAWV